MRTRSAIILGAALAAGLAALLIWVLLRSVADDPATTGLPETAAPAVSPSPEAGAPRSSSRPAEAPTAIPHRPFVDTQAEPPSQAEGSVSGRVLDALAEPVSDAEIQINDVAIADSVELARTRSGADGRFTVARVPMRSGIQVRATGPNRSDAIEHVTLSPEEPAARVELRLWDTGSVRGIVVDWGEKPVAGATVAASAAGSRALPPFRTLAETTTDADGKFELSRVALGASWIFAFAPGHGSGRQKLALRDSANVTIRLDGSGIEVAAHVVGVGDAPARILMIPYEEGGALALPAAITSGPVDAQGAWRRTGLPDLEYLVRAFAEGYSFQPQSYRTKSGKPQHEVTFTAFKAGAVTLTGMLHDAEGVPLSGETIVVRPASMMNAPSAVTKADGTFSIAANAAPGTDCTATLVKSKFALRDGDPSPRSDPSAIRGRIRFKLDPSAKLDLTAVPAARISGRVVTAAGVPVSGIPVTLQQAAPDGKPLWWTPFAYGRSLADGRFEFFGVSETDQAVRVQARGSEGQGASDKIKVERGKDLENVSVVIGPSGVVEGTVKDKEGKPVPGVRVQLMNWDLATNRQRDGSVQEVISDRNGRYRQVDVDPGGHFLRTLVGVGRRKPGPDPERSPLDMGMRHESFDVAPGAVVHRDLVVDPAE